MYGGAAAAVVWLVGRAVACWSQEGSRPRSLALLALAAALVALVAVLATQSIVFEAIDFEYYPLPARITVFSTLLFVGWMMSTSGARRWRSSVSLTESRAVVRSGQWNGFSGLGRIAVIAAFAVLAIVMALPEWFLGK